MLTYNHLLSSHAEKKSILVDIRQKRTYANKGFIKMCITLFTNSQHYSRAFLKVCILVSYVVDDQHRSFSEQTIC